ncbi:MAG: amidohydrolase family protein [Bacillota bacterium]
MPKAITNAIVYDFETFHNPGYVLFDESIIKTGPMDAFKESEADEIIDGTDHLVMPSLVVGHTHIYSAFARGWMNPETFETFPEILEKQWWKLDSGHSLASLYASGIVSAVDHVKNGVTTLIDHNASGTIKGALETLKKAVVDDVGLRGMFAFETSDRFNVDECIDENKAFIKSHQSELVSGHFGLHASFTLSEDTLKKVRENLNGAPIHIHVAEGKEDEDHAINTYGERVVERLSRHGLITKDSILTHALFVDDKERDLIKKHGAIVALNPGSNMNNGVGLPDYRALKAKNIPVILGNDGLSMTITQEYLNLFFGSHLKTLDPQGFGMDDLIRVIDDTYAYASRRLGIKLGRFKNGYKADLLMHPYTPPTPINKDNALGHLVFGMFSSFKPSDVFIDGKRIVKDYDIDTRTNALYKNAMKEAEALWLRLKEGRDPHES